MASTDGEYCELPSNDSILGDLPSNDLCFGSNPTRQMLVVECKNHAEPGEDGRERRKNVSTLPHRPTIKECQNVEPAANVKSQQVYLFHTRNDHEAAEVLDKLLIASYVSLI